VGDIVELLYGGAAGLSSGINTGDNATNSQYSGLAASKKDAAYLGQYNSEIVTAPTSGTLTLKMATETYIGSLTNANTFTVALPSPILGLVTESILIFKVGASLPTITQPTGIVWRGATPTLAINKTYTICYEQINTAGSTYEIYGTAVQNV
jgi:hypothetical protein